MFWPSGILSRFEDLAIKTIVVATNYLDRNEVTYDAGPLRPAVAGSMAIPGLFRPVIFRDEVLIDVGVVNPLPYDLLFSLADIVVAVDVTWWSGAETTNSIAVCINVRRRLYMAR